MTSYSVVIPAFNAERTLATAIEYVLSQTIVPTRVIVVDDGSTDRTAEIARKYGPQVVAVAQQANSGPGAATTRGFAAVTTPLVACIDADDIWLPEKASRQIERLEQHADLDAVFGWMKQFRHGEPPRANAPVQENWGRSTMMMRTSTVWRIGSVIDPAGIGCGDMVDWLARARELNCKLEMMPVVMALRRIIPGSLSYARDTRGQGYLHIVKAALDRKRAK